MSNKHNEIKKRELEALSAIKIGLGKEEGVDLFVEHHLNELDKTYWINKTGNQGPALK